VPTLATLEAKYSKIGKTIKKQIKSRSGVLSLMSSVGKKMKPFFKALKDVMF
jgi:hypothetical protein